jgi:hypothetical protein
MPVYEVERRVIAGGLTINLRIDADEGPCEHCQQHADEVALLVSTLADEDDDAVVLAHKIIGMFATLASVSVSDDQGNGCTVRHDH